MTRLSSTPLMRLVVCGAFVLLAGCGGMGGKTSQLYVLNPSVDVKTDTAASNKQLAISMPSAPAYLDTTRIALSRSSTTTDYFASSDWTDRVPVLVQDLTVKAFEKSGKVKAVFRDSGMFKADYGVQIEIRNFDAQYAGSSGAPNVAVSFDLRLIKQPERDIVATHTVGKTVRAGANNLDSIVGAFNEALGGALAETVDWTLRTMPAAPPKRVHHRRHRAKAAAPTAQPVTPQQ
jgi:cholesterol transport system auxiliary component